MAIPVDHVVVAHARSPMEAQVIGLLLRNAALHPLIPEEHLLSLGGAFDMNPLRACAVCLPAHEAAQARAILAAARADGTQLRIEGAEKQKPVRTTPPPLPRGLAPSTQSHHPAQTQRTATKPGSETRKSVPVRFGILGAGRIVSGRFVPALRKCPSTALEAVATREPFRARELGATRVFGNYSAVIESSNVDAVYVATHNGLHHELAMAALRAGKHVLCEKPLGRNSAECRELLECAQAKGLMLMEAFMYRFHPQIAVVRELLASGAIGAVRSVEASFSFLLTRIDDVRLKPAWGGGSMLDVGSYCVNFARMVLGDEPVAVQARATFDPVHGIDTNLSGILDFGAGRHALLGCGFDGGPRNRALICGAAGSIELPRAFLTYPDIATHVYLHREDEIEVHELPARDSFQLMIAGFAEAIRKGIQAPLAPDEGWKNARIMEALLESAQREGAAIPLRV